MKEKFSIESVLHLHHVKSPYEFIFKKLECLVRTQNHDFEIQFNHVISEQNLHKLINLVFYETDFLTTTV
jgi:hypothetical protein